MTEITTSNTAGPPSAILEDTGIDGAHLSPEYQAGLPVEPDPTAVLGGITKALHERATDTTEPEQPVPVLDRATYVPLQAGLGVERKGVLRAEIDHRRVQLLEREYSQRHVESWEAYQAAGLPVVPDLWVMEENGQKHVVVTDVKADGSELYGKALLYSFMEEDSIPRDRPPDPSVDARFIELTSPEGIGNIKALASYYLAIAEERGLGLPMDDAFELHVKPDGSWDLKILDLSSAKYGLSEETAPGFAQKNDEYTERFLSRLLDIREGLLEQHQPTKRQGTFWRRGWRKSR